MLTVTQPSYGQQYDMVTNLNLFYCDGDTLKPTDLRDSFAWGPLVHRVAYNTICDSVGNLLLFTALNIEYANGYGSRYYGLYDKYGNILTRIADSTNGVDDNVRANSQFFVSIPGSQKVLLFVGGTFMEQNSSNNKRPLSYFVIDNVNTDPTVSEEQVLNVRSCFHTTATYHTNKKDIWVVTQSYDSLYTYLVSATGIGDPIVSAIADYDKANWSSRGMRFSLSGKSLLIPCRNWKEYSKGGLHLINLHFDQSTGRFSARHKPNYIPYPRNNLRLDGAEFVGQTESISFFSNSEDSLIACYVGARPDQLNLVLIDTKTSTLSRVSIGVDDQYNKENFNRLANFQYTNAGKQIIFARYNAGFGSRPLYLTLDSKIKDNVLRAKVRLVPKDVDAHFHYLITHNTPQILYNPHPLGFSYTRNCDSTLQFMVQGDTTFFKTYQWEFPDGEVLWGDTVTKKFNKEEIQQVKLTGTTAWGYSRWVADTFSVLSNYFKPHAKFDIADTVGCQWIAQHYVNTSKFQNKGRPIKELWSFGDGTFNQSIDTSIDLTSPSKTYTMSGNYTVSLLIDDGYCADTMTLLNGIDILAAPKPELSLSTHNGCDPLTVEGTYLRNDAVDSITYTWDRVTKKDVYSPSSTNFLSEKVFLGLNEDLVKHPIMQTLYGPTGCVTHDTSYVDILKTFGKNAYPYLNLVTVNDDDHIHLFWDSLEGVKTYEVTRDGTKIGVTTDLVYIDSIASTSKNHTYQIIAVNHCDGMSQKSNVGINMVLSGYAEGNDYSSLQWSPYAQWKEPLGQYDLEFWHSINPNEVSLLSAQTSLIFTDHQFSNLEHKNLGASKCYRVKTTNTVTMATSHSNILCLDYTPTTFIPSAFTPNDDNLNDVFTVIGIAIESYELSIYNSYGEKIFNSSIPSWDGTYKGVKAPEGYYLYTIQVKAYDGSVEHYKGTITLLK
jgi:gliding motility-associated-like protein